MGYFRGTHAGFIRATRKIHQGFQIRKYLGTIFYVDNVCSPLVASFALIKDFGQVFSSVSSDVLVKMAIASLLWGTGVMMWGKAINHIGLSLGFSLFIGTVILVGSILPFLVDGLPENNAFLTIMGVL